MVGSLVADAGVDFVGGGMVALLEENAEDDLALGSGAQTAVGQFLGQQVGGVSGVGNHVKGQQIGMVLRIK